VPPSPIRRSSQLLGLLTHRHDSDHHKAPSSHQGAKHPGSRRRHGCCHGSDEATTSPRRARFRQRVARTGPRSERVPPRTKPYRLSQGSSWPPKPLASPRPRAAKPFRRRFSCFEISRNLSKTPPWMMSALLLQDERISVSPDLGLPYGLVRSKSGTTYKPISAAPHLSMEQLGTGTFGVRRECFCISGLIGLSD
jgi:hypothetical protein